MRRWHAATVAAIMAMAACGGGGGGDREVERAAGADRTSSSTTASERTTTSTEAAPSTSPGDTPTTAQPSAPPTTAAAPATTPAPPTTAAPITVFAPPPGTYVYDAAGHTTSSDIGGGRERVPPVSTDTVTHRRAGGADRVTMATRDQGAAGHRELVVDVDDDSARLARLTFHLGGGASVGMAPSPPAELARFPLQVGDEWELAWSDGTSGVSGAGTGRVLRREAVATPAGTFDTVVVHVTQRLRGSISGMLSLTAWIDTSTGVHVQQHLVAEVHALTGASGTDTTRTLREVRR